MPTFEAELSDGTTVEFEADHQPTQEELESAAGTQLKTEPAEPDKPTSAAGAFASNFATAVLPTGAAAVTGTVGMRGGRAVAAMLPLAARSRGASLLLPLAGMAVGGAAGAALTDVAQGKVLEHVAPEFVKRSQQAAQEHPVAAAAGRLTAMLPSFAVDPGATVKGLATLPAIVRSIAGKGTLTAAQKKAALATATQFGVQGGLLAGQTAIQEKKLPTAGQWTEAGIAAFLFGAPRFPTQKLLPRATAAARQAINQPAGQAAAPPPVPAAPTTGSPNATPQGQVQANVPAERPGNAPGGTPTQPELSGGVQPGTQGGSQVAQTAQVPLTPRSPEWHQALTNLGYNTRDRMSLTPEQAQAIISGKVQKPGTTAPAGSGAAVESSQKPIAQEIAELENDPEVRGSREVGFNPDGSVKTEDVVVNQAKVRRLESLKAIQGQGQMRQQPEPNLPGMDAVEASEREAIDAASQGNRTVGLPHEVVDAGQVDPNAPFAREIATVDEQGRIVLNRPRFRQWLSTIPEEHQPAAIQALFTEEGIHSIARRSIGDDELTRLWQSLTQPERALVETTYFGDQRAKARPQFSDAQMGHEYLRRAMQRLLRMDVREVAEARGKPQFFKESLLNLIESIIVKARSLLGTRSSTMLHEMLDRLQDNVSVAKGEPFKTAAPGAFHKSITLRHGDGTAEEGTFDGYWDLREVGGGLHPTVSRRNPEGDWTTGMLRPGEEIEGRIPTFEQWKAPKVRLYHGEGGPEGAGTGGSWFTADPNYAATMGDRVSFVDVPKWIADEAQQQVRDRGQGGPHFILPDEYVRQAQPMQNAPEARRYELAPGAFSKAEQRIRQDLVDQHDENLTRVLAIESQIRAKPESEWTAADRTALARAAEIKRTAQSEIDELSQGAGPAGRERHFPAAFAKYAAPEMDRSLEESLLERFKRVSGDDAEAREMGYEPNIWNALEYFAIKPDNEWGLPGKIRKQLLDYWAQAKDTTHGRVELLAGNIEASYQYLQHLQDNLEKAKTGLKQTQGLKDYPEFRKLYLDEYSRTNQSIQQVIDEVQAEQRLLAKLAPGRRIEDIRWEERWGNEVPPEPPEPESEEWKPSHPTNPNDPKQTGFDFPGAFDKYGRPIEDDLFKKVLPPVPGQVHESPELPRGAAAGELPMTRTGKGVPVERSVPNLPRVTAQVIETEADRQLAGTARPSFEDFTKQVRASFGGVQPAQLRDAWTDAVWKRLMAASGEELTGLVRGMGLTKALALETPQGETRRVPDAFPEPKGFGLQTEIEGAARRQIHTEQQEAKIAQSGGLKLRANIIATLGNKLINEAQEGRKAWHRPEITPEDLVIGEKAWTALPPSEEGNRALLGGYLTQGARAFGGAKLRKVIGGKPVEIKQKGLPVSVTHRVAAIMDRTSGKVFLVSAYNDGRRGPVLLDPMAPGKSHAPLSSILTRFRVLGTSLLNEPVQGFEQRFDSLRDFEESFATPARRLALGEFGQKPLAEGEEHVPGSWEVNAPVTDAEALAVLDHVTGEVGRFEGPDDVRASLVALSEEKHRQALSAYRKLFAQLEKQNPRESTEELLERLARQIYGNHKEAKTADDFIARTVAQGNPEAGKAPGVQPQPTPIQGRVEPRLHEFPIPEGRAIPTVGKIPWHGPQTFPLPEGPAEMLPPAAAKEVLRQAGGKHPTMPKVLYRQLGQREVPKERYTMGRRKSLEQIEAEAQPSKPEAGEAPGAFLKDMRDTAQEELARGFGLVDAAIRRNYTDKQVAASRDAVDTISNNRGRQAENAIRTVTAKRVPGQLRQPEFYGKQDVLAAANAVIQAGAVKPNYVIDATAQAALDQIVQNDPRLRLAQNMIVASDQGVRTSGFKLFQTINADAIRQVIQAGLISTKGLTYSFSQSAAGQLDGFLVKIDRGIAKARAAMQTGNLIKRAEARKWLKAAEALRREVTYAKAHWNDADLQATATRMKAELDNQYNLELEAGYNARFDQDYLPGRYDAEFFNDHAVTFGGLRILGRRFTSPKTFPTYYDAIEAGPYIPATRDGAAIIGHRVRQGARRVQFANWIEGLKKIMDPVTNRPIAADPKAGPDGRYLPPSAEHELMYLIKGRKPIAVRRGFKDIVEQVTDPSKIQNFALTRTALEWGQKLKHTILLGDVFHLARLGWYSASIMGSKADWRKGLTAIEYRDADLDAAVRSGVLRPQDAAWCRQQVPVRLGPRTSYLTRRQLVEEFERTGLNVGRIQDAIYKDLVAHVPMLGRYNKWLFDRFTRGLMMQAAVQSFERMNAKHPNVDARALMRDVSRDVNNFYGSLGRQGVFKSQTMQDLARLAFLAPQWVEGLVMKEAGFYGRVTGASNLLGRRGLPQLGTLGSGIGSGLVGMVVMTQLINLINRGKPTWENPEKGHMFDAWIPSMEKGGNGFFFSPLAIFNELSHDLVRLYETKPKAWDAITQIGENKLSPWGRVAVVLKESREPGSGARITTTTGVAKAAAKQFLPVPITVSSAGQALAAKTTGLVKPPPPGSVQRQVMASFGGMKVEPARSHVQEIGDKAGEWVKKSGLQKTTGWMQVPTDEPSYSKLRSALRVGDQTGAAVLLAELRKTHTIPDILKAMKLSANRPFTGSKKAERAFLYSLGPEDLALYSAAQQDRQREYEAFVSFLLRQPFAVPQQAR